MIIARSRNCHNDSIVCVVKVVKLSHYLLFNPFSNKPWFLSVCSTRLLKTLWEKEKIARTRLLKTLWEKEKIARNEQFPFFPLCFQLV